MNKITLGELGKGCAAFWKNEPRDAMYRIASKLVEEGWSKPADVADGLGVVLLTWNQAAYRYGSFNFDDLEQFLKTNKTIIEFYRGRRIETFTAKTDADKVKSLFDKTLDALAYSKPKRKSPVGAAKALHILAPEFFPLWDDKIAKGCQCYWSKPKQASTCYVAFIEYVQGAIASLEAQFASGKKPASLPPARNLAASLSIRAGSPKTILKFLDEYLYAKYTKSWS